MERRECLEIETLIPRIIRNTGGGGGGASERGNPDGAPLFYLTRQLHDFCIKTVHVMLANPNALAPHWVPNAKVVSGGKCALSFF